MSESPQWEPCDEPSDNDAWIVPPACQGQIVEVAYSTSSGPDHTVYRRIWDRSDNSREYARRLLGDGECFDPWNAEPA